MDILKKDKSFVWHPFTHQLDMIDPIVISKGEGVFLIDEMGEKYIDAISSWWVNLHGHCNSYISGRLGEQLFKLEHCLFSDFTHGPAATLAENLIDILPANQAKIFYSDNGSTAVEVAIKMVLQYWHNQNIEKKTLIAIEGSYHGDTFGGMSVGARNVFNNAFESHLFEVKFIPFPTSDNRDIVVEKFEEIARVGDVAGFIFEPLVQGAAGMRMYSAEILDRLIEISNQYSICTIADEVMTGFGRTGKYFSCEYMNNLPDLVCMSKGLTGGYLPLGATSCASFVYEKFLDQDRAKTFFHGHSYTANPLACVAAIASLELLKSEECQNSIRSITETNHQFKEQLSDRNSILDVRTLGTILAIELKTEESTDYLNSISNYISSWFLRKRIVLRPLGNVFYLIPPYVVTPSQMEYLQNCIVDFLDKFENEKGVKSQSFGQ